MQTDRSDKLVIVEVKWQEKATNAWLLREVFDLLLRDPDLTDGDVPLTMELQAILDEEGGKR